MSGIEQAIENLEYFIGGDCCDNQMDFLEEIGMGIAALREKAERSKGCCYCNTGEPLNGYEDVGSFIILPKGKKYYLEIAFSNDFYSCATDINFCPNCGKRLEVEP